MNAEQIDGLLADHRRFHSPLQIDRFVIANSGINRYGMYRQALREIDGRWGALKERWCQILLKAIELERVKPTAEDDLAAAEVRIRHVQITMQIADMKAVFEDAADELCRFVLIAEKLKAEVGELTEEWRATLELDYMVAFLMRQAGLEIHSYGRPTLGTIQSLTTLPEQVRRDCFNALKNPAMVAQNALELPYTPPDVTPTIAQREAVKELVRQCL